MASRISRSPAQVLTTALRNLPHVGTLVLLLTVATSTTSASPYPGTGFLYQDIRGGRLQTLPRSAPEPEVDVAPPSRTGTGATVEVSHFVVYGNTTLSDKDLGEALKPYSHRTLSDYELHTAADALRARYREAGLFLAEVFIPPQALDDGVVTLHVYEGAIEEGGVELDARGGDNVQPETVAAILESTIVTGGVLHRDEIERAVLLTDDLPGITSHSVIYPGTAVGEARLRVLTENSSRFTGNIDFDNFGNYYTGEERLGATLYWNSPTSKGDQLTLRAVTSGSGSNYLFVDYSVPVSGSGLRLGANVDYLDYELSGQFSGSSGDAGSIRLFASYPWKRSRHANHTGRLEYAYLSLEDDGRDGELLSDRRISTLTASLNGDMDHDRWANGITYYDVSLTAGDVDIRGGDSFIEFDDTFVETAGGFARVNFQVSRLQHLTGAWSTHAALTGQWASGNLDPSQKFFVGGPFTVPGYPTGEASGDHGANLHLDVRYDFANAPWGGALQGTVFYSAGWVQLFDEPWNGWEGDNPLIENSYTLQSYGLSVSQTWSSGMIVRASVGRQVGSNPGRNPVSGDFADRSSSSYRAWLQAIYYF